VLPHPGFVFPLPCPATTPWQARLLKENQAHVRRSLSRRSHRRSRTLASQGIGDGRLGSGSGDWNRATGHGAMPEYRGGWALHLAPWILHPGGWEGG